MGNSARHMELVNTLIFNGLDANPSCIVKLGLLKFHILNTITMKKLQSIFTLLMAQLPLALTFFCIHHNAFYHAIICTIAWALCSSIAFILIKSNN